jgi:hypothetical protein
LDKEVAIEVILGMVHKTIIAIIVS